MAYTIGESHSLPNAYRNILDFGSGTSCACGYTAVRHCTSYTYVCASTALRALLKRQWNVNASKIICERARFVLAGSLVEYTATDAHCNIKSLAGRGAPRVARTGGQQDVVLVRVNVACSPQQAMILARKHVSPGDVVILVSETGLSSEATSSQLQALDMNVLHSSECILVVRLS